MRALILLAFVAIIAIPGCGGCFRVDGTWKTYSGGVEYCFDRAKSDAAGAPILTGESGEELAAFSDDQVATIWEKIKGAVGMSAKLEKTTPEMVREILEASGSGR